MTTPPKPPPSKFAAARAATSPPTTPSRFAAALSGARVFRPVTIPGLNVVADMTVVGSATVAAIEGAMYRTLEADGVPELSTLTAMTYEACRAVLTLAAACFDPEARARGELVPIATVAEWRDLPEEWIDPVWGEYKLLRAQLDPVEEPLTMAERAALRDAVKKKDRASLLAFGPSRLTAFLLSTDDPPPT